MSLSELVEMDASLSQRLRLEPGKHFLWQIMVFFAHSGDSWFWLAGLGLVWLASWPLNNPLWRTLSALMAAGVVGLAVVVLGIKFLVKRQRPPGEWGAIYRNTDPHSFPSGHAARAFMLAVIALGLGPLWFGVIMLVWAPLVCLARVATGVHYISDVVAGMILGCLAGWVLLSLLPFFVSLMPILF
jgi:membrane-associated phospholipid phosphatase